MKPASARAIGTMLIILLVMSLMIPYILLHPVSAPADAFLANAAPMAATLKLCLIMLLIGAAAPLAISIALWPDMTRAHARLGLWLLAVAILNATLQLLENTHWLSLLSLSQAASGDPADAAAITPALAGVVRASWRWVHYTHITLIVAWLFTLFLVMLKTRAAPRAIAWLGMIAVPAHLYGIVLPVFAGYRMWLPDLFGIPLAIAIVALSLWLLVRGFDSSSDLGRSPEPATTR